MPFYFLKSRRWFLFSPPLHCPSLLAFCISVVLQSTPYQVHNLSVRKELPFSTRLIPSMLACLAPRAVMASFCSHILVRLMASITLSQVRHFFLLHIIHCRLHCPSDTYPILSQVSVFCPSIYSSTYEIRRKNAFVPNHLLGRGRLILGCCQCRLHHRPRKRTHRH